MIAPHWRRSPDCVFAIRGSCRPRDKLLPKGTICGRWFDMRKIRNPRARRKGFTLGRADFEKISAVEGIRYPAEMKRTFRQLDKQGASPAQRRQVIARKYGRPS